MRRFLPLLLLSFLAVAGCDTVDEGNVLLSPRDVAFDFRVNASELTVGEQVTVTATGTNTLQGKLDGFSLNELVAARVTKVQLRRTFPLGAGNSLGDLLESAKVSVAAGTSQQQVASGGSLGSGADATLDVTGADVVALLRQPTFSARLGFVPKKATPNTEYTYRVTLTLALEVEGL